MPKQFMKKPCWLCGKEISKCGFARVSHYRAHVRRGELVEMPREYGNYGSPFVIPEPSINEFDHTADAARRISPANIA